MRDPNPSSKIGRLQRRADFLRVAKGKRWHCGAMTVQAARSQAFLVSTEGAEASAVRIGFTLTRKVGNAVVRNRIRRRLKEAVRLSPDLPLVAHHDYVIIGRIEALRLPFESLRRDLARAIRAVHETGRPGRPRSERRPGTAPQPDTPPPETIRPKRTRPEP